MPDVFDLDTRRHVLPDFIFGAPVATVSDSDSTTDSATRPAFTCQRCPTALPSLAGCRPQAEVMPDGKLARLVPIKATGSALKTMKHREA